MALQPVTSGAAPLSFAFLQAVAAAGSVGRSDGASVPAPGHREGPVQLVKRRQALPHVKILILVYVHSPSLYIH